MNEHQGIEAWPKLHGLLGLPWTCDQRLSCLLPLRDEGVPGPGLSGPGPQFLLEAAPRHHPPSLGMPGLLLPGFPAGGGSGPLCWSLGAGGSQESSERDPGSSPERGKEEKSVKGKVPWGMLDPERGSWQFWVPGSALSLLPILSIQTCWTLHLHCHILLLHGTALPRGCHCHTFQFSFFPVLLDLLGANIQGDGV